MKFSNPESLQEAYAVLSKGNWKILSGGTDFYPALGERRPDFDVLDISRISSLRKIEKDKDGNWHIGALVTWTDIIKHNLPSAFDALKLSAKEVGSIQIQNRATIVGNICNASPAADGVPPLLTLGAIVKIGSAANERELALEDFISGNREINLGSDEIVTGIKIPAGCVSGKSSFLKLGTRKYLVISISMVSSRLTTDAHDRISDAAIAVGSCSIVARRLHALEDQLLGKSIHDELGSLIEDKFFDVLSPIDDVRATKEFRMDATKELICRSVYALTGGK